MIDSEDWSVEEIKTLRDLYSGRSFIYFKRSDLESPLIQKALNLLILVMAGPVQYDGDVKLLVSKEGYDLFNKI